MSAVLSWANCVNEIQHIKARVEEKRGKKIKGTQRHVGIWADSPARYYLATWCCLLYYRGGDPWGECFPKPPADSEENQCWLTHCQFLLFLCFHAFTLPFTFFFQHGKTTSFSIYKTFPPLCLTCLIWSTPPSVSFQAHLVVLITMYAICFGLNVFDNFILESSLNCFIDY